jgi:type VI secretion system FHA domain protein
MQLVLTVASYNGLPPPVATVVRVGDQDCVIGRHPDCQLELPDPECLVSGRHAVIGRYGSGFAITDLESTNGTFLNDAEAPITPNAPCMLHQGDKIAMGPYVVSVTLDEGRVSVPEDPFALAGKGALPGIPDPHTSPDIMELLGSGPEGQFDALEQARPPEPPRPSVENIHFNVPQASTDKDIGAADSDQAELPAEPPGERPRSSQQAASGRSPAAIPDDYDLLSDAFTASDEHDASRPTNDEPVSIPPASVPTEELTVGVPNPPEAGASAQRMKNEAPSVNLELTSGQRDEKPRDDTQGRNVGPAADAPRPHWSSNTSARGNGQSADLDAFLAGLGVGRPPAIEDSEALLRLSGQLLRAMTEGLMAVMMARASFKSELRLEVTTIRSRDNNPFQFCVDADDALERLLWRHSRGFLDPPDAVHKTFDDIQAHQMAMIAGLRAAMRALLGRFQPDQLEQHFERQSHLDKLLPMARKSKCWDLFVSTFDQVADDAAEDFMRLFGDAFNRAYEEQARRLNAAQQGSSV